MTLDLTRIAAITGAELRLATGAEASTAIHQVATLASATPGTVSFLANPRYRAQLRDTRASAVFVAEESADGCPSSALVHAEPYLAFARAAQALNPPPQVAPGVAPSACVEPGAEVSSGASICAGAVVAAGARVAHGAVVGPGSVLGAGAAVGEGSRLVARVTVVDGCVVGARCLVHPGVVIGADGFGIARRGDGGWEKIPQIGRVRVGDDVEIGANTCIDRGALEDTLIGNGVKLDNLVQIGHGARIGEHTAIAACVAIAGSASIGARCVIQGACSIAGHLEIADDVTLTATSAVPSSIPEAGVYSSGMPIQKNRQWRRNVVRMTQLDEMSRRLKALERAQDQPLSSATRVERGE